MKVFSYAWVLMGLSTGILHGLASADDLHNGEGINTAFSDGWPPLYSTSKPQDLCGDTIGHDKSSDQVPDTKDCATLRDQMDANPGLWNITADAGRPYNYILLASHGTCAFVAAPLDPNKDCLIGSQDVRDLVNDQVTNYAGYSISSTMGCTVNIATDWAIIHT
ncbi:hypothetical protein VM1G_10890 [Cytospora mali]|uniref:Ecp2 effector protein-like domain-containing protein n=1 Tax=Cytospora mali TaxID=578113 RepID=A0A194VIX3_CYTMA|nr:hypothetical protein VM1G_10890 [Valsa mali]